MRALWLLMMALPIAAASAQELEPVAPTPAAESLRFNSRERTEQALQRLEEGNTETAIELLDAAKRLDRGDGRTSFNAATARLLGKDESAADRLTEALAIAPPELQAATNYNLGNARLEKGELEPAIEAFKEALRVDPSLVEAKFNLEVAQRLLEEQQRQQQQQNSQESSSRDKESEPKSQDEADPRPRESQPPEEEEPPAQPPPQPEERAEAGDQDSPQQSPLPDFEEQQDMTAEQAAAILEAVENLERDQRRQRAEERSRRRSKAGKDW